VGISSSSYSLGNRYVQKTGIYDNVQTVCQRYQGKTTKFVMRVEGNTVNIWLNEDLLVENHEIEGLSDSPSIRLAIGAKYAWAGSTLTYQNLEIEQVEPEK